MKDKSKYVNERLRDVSYEELKRILWEFEKKHEFDRMAQREALDRALVDGFRCGPRRPD